MSSKASAASAMKAIWATVWADFETMADDVAAGAGTPRCPSRNTFTASPPMYAEGTTLFTASPAQRMRRSARNPSGSLAGRVQRQARQSTT